MTSNAALLVDKARITCSPATYAALAMRLGVSRQNVHQWKKGSAPVAEKHLRSMCRMAGLDPAEWWLAVQADSAPEAIRGKVHAMLVRAGIAALLAIASAPGMASASHIHAGTAYYVRRRLLTLLNRCGFPPLCWPLLNGTMRGPALDRMRDGQVLALQS